MLPARADRHDGKSGGGENGMSEGIRITGTPECVFKDTVFYEMKSHSDVGLILQPDQWALIIQDDGRLGLRIPDIHDNDEVPRLALVLTAALVRADDAEWVEEMVEWFRDIEQQ